MANEKCQIMSNVKCQMSNRIVLPSDIVLHSAPAACTCGLLLPPGVSNLRNLWMIPESRVNAQK